MDTARVNSKKNHGPRFIGRFIFEADGKAKAELMVRKALLYVWRD